MTASTDEAHEQGTPAWLQTVRGTIRVSQPDVSMLYPNTCAVLLETTASPTRALDVDVSAAPEFLRAVTPACAKMIDGSVQCEHLFDTAVPDDLPTDHKPTDRWAGARLKVLREFRSRVLPKLTRRVERRRNDQRLGFSDGIWMHVKPLGEETERYLNDKARDKEHDGEATPTDKEHVPSSEGSRPTASSASFGEPRSTSLD